MDRHALFVAQGFADLAGRIAARRVEPRPAAALQPPGLAAAHDDDGEHVDSLCIETGEGGDVDALALPPEIAGDDHGAVEPPVGGEDIPRLCEPAAALP